ncbi:MAG: aminoglycoside phosphotransferase family protein [Elusimicrobia bacterium]|nr:aminoglycoside phosphotransferase family protein [Elusimicrobiota bacterium]
MRVGVDFDNTLACYDGVFHQAALEKGLIPQSLPASKNSVRDYLRRAGREPSWTKLQGLVYGKRMGEVAPFPGTLEFFKLCRERGLELFIISHKTRQPSRGEACDLVAAALAWLKAKGFLNPERGGIESSRVYFEPSKLEKLERISRLACDVFVDDLPEFLAEPEFPAGTRKILFDPGEECVAGSFWTARSWAEIGGRLLAPAEAESPAYLSVEAGLGELLSLSPLLGGANNQVFRLRACGGSALLKAYFRDGPEGRDRLGAEFAFCRYAWSRGARRAPKPLACDSERGLGLYEWIEGCKLKAGEPQEAAVEEALAFLEDLNRDRSEDLDLPEAAEACFTLRAHLDAVEGRLERLRRLAPSGELDGRCLAFVQGEIWPRWQEERRRAEAESLSDDRGLDEPLAREDRILSPSDFGFHNALLSAEGRMRFFDFEYAGWDDPAKLVCDFFCQPAVPAAPELLPIFSERVAALTAHPGLQLKRFERLAGVYRLKWVGILLNDFLPQAGRRRRFALGAAAEAERKAEQLDKARLALEGAAKA